MILNSIELNVYPNKDGSTFDGKFYYNARDIRALNKVNSDPLGISHRILLDACFFSRKMNEDFSEQGIVVYDYIADMFGHTFLEENKNQLLVGLKEMSFPVFKQFLQELINASLDSEIHVPLYLSFRGDMHVLCTREGKLLSEEEYDALLVQLEESIVVQKESLPTPEKDIPSIKESISISLEKKDITDVLQSLKDCVAEKKEILKQLHQQIAEVEDLLDENALLDQQIEDSKKKIEEMRESSIERVS